MKTKQTFTILLTLFLFIGAAKSQSVSTFENVTLGVEKYWNGSDFSGGFSSGNAFFVNTFDTTFGDYWEGFAVSATTDDSTATYLNQYSAITGTGVGGSAAYAVNYDHGKIRLTGAAAGKVVNGFYITNSTYGYYAMKNGTSFSKKFGDSSGNAKDYFFVRIKAWRNGAVVNDSVDFYLADFRFNDNTKDYIVNTWQWVDLVSLGNADSLSFNYFSSDTGAFGINNPKYFCMDDFNRLVDGVETISSANSFNMYPNPATSIIHVEMTEKAEAIHVYNLQGELLIETKNTSIDISGMDRGIYLIQVKSESGLLTKRFMKE